MKQVTSRLVIYVAALFAAFDPAGMHAQEIKVTLLGTGCPPPVMDRFGPSILVEAAGDKFLFDAGRGALQRLTQIGVRWQEVHGLFITHLHSDHVVGFPDLWLTGWIFGPGRNIPLPIWGPPGTKKMMSHLEQAYAFDINIRVTDDRVPREGAALRVTEIKQGLLYDKEGVKITAFEVDHAPVKPAFGYRIDSAGRSVVLSGDTRISENLVRHAQGVDLLIHEVAAPDVFSREGVAPERARRIIGHHTTPEQAGEVFSRTKPRLAVYSHIVPVAATEQDLIPPTRKTYSGPLEVGEDLMVIEIGERIDIRRPHGTVLHLMKDP